MENPRGTDPSQLRNDYINLIINRNGGRLNILEDHYFYALGFDANLENWKLNIAAISFTKSDSSSTTKRLKNLEKTLFTDNDQNIGIIPTIFTQYFFNPERTSHIGFGFGYFKFDFYKKIVEILFRV